MDTELDANRPTKRVNQFLYGFQDYVKNSSPSRDYLGNFLFEKYQNGRLGVTDGQQCLTTITILIAFLFNRLRQIRNLSEEETCVYMNTVKMRQKYRVSTVDYDNQLFKDYVINQIKTDGNGIDAESKKTHCCRMRLFL